MKLELFADDDQINSEKKTSIHSKLVQEHFSEFFSLLGLSKTQEKVYHLLAQEGPKTASQISKILKIPRTETYSLVKIMQTKGCIVLKNDRPWKFKALSIEEFLENKILVEKKKIQKIEETLYVIKAIKASKGFAFNTNTMA